MPTEELIRAYFKNANLSNSLEDIRLPPKGRRERGRPPIRRKYKYS